MTRNHTDGALSHPGDFGDHMHVFGDLARNVPTAKILAAHLQFVGLRTT